MAETRNCSEKTDEELVRLALSNQEWFVCLLRRYEEKLSRFIRRISNVNQQDLEDMLQEIFIKVYRNLNGFDPDLKFSSWIYRIARNHVISHHRKSQTRPQSIGGEEGEKILRLIQDDKNPHDKMDRQISLENIQNILSQMDQKYQEVIILKYLEDKDYQEISDIIKRPIGTVGTFLNRAKKQFKEIAIKKGTKF